MTKPRPPCLLFKRKRFLWGQPYMIRPALVKRKFGNGKRLIKLYPIMHRPFYYLVYIDDSWGFYNSDENPLIDHLDDIYEEIADEFGERPEGEAEDYQWPEADFDGGSCWEETTKRAEKLSKSAGLILAGIAIMSWFTKQPIIGSDLLLAAGIGVLFGTISAIHFRYERTK